MLTACFPVALRAAGRVEKPASYRHFFDFPGSNYRLRGRIARPKPVILTPGGAALPRTRARRARAQRNGNVGFFKLEYKRRRREAQADFMSYRAAQARLRNALVGVAAGDTSAIVRRVFEN